MSQFRCGKQAQNYPETSNSKFGISVHSHPRPEVAGHLARCVFQGWRTTSGRALRSFSAQSRERKVKFRIAGLLLRLSFVPCIILFHVETGEQDVRAREPPFRPSHAGIRGRVRGAAGGRLRARAVSVRGQATVESDTGLNCLGFPLGCPFRCGEPREEKYENTLHPP